MAIGTTVGGLVERVHRDALIASRGPAYTLESAYTAGGTAVTLNESATHIGQGAILAIDYELFYVQSYAASSKTATVIPGFYGTAQANHAADAVVEVDPRVPRSNLIDHAQHEIMSWGRELFRITDLVIQTNASDRAYDLGSTGVVYFLLDARMRPEGSTTNWWDFSWTHDAWPHMDARLVRNADPTEFPSGLAIQFRQRPTRSTVIRVAIAQPLTISTFTPTTDLVTDVGCQLDWLEIIEHGMRWRALQSLATGRLDWRSGSAAREAEEVTPLDVVRGANMAADMRQFRFSKAAVDLRGDWPFRESMV